MLRIMMLLTKARNDAIFAHCAAGPHHCRRQHHWAQPTSFAVGKHHFKKALHWSAFLISPAYKPGSVVNGHQSSLCVTAKLQGESLVPPPRCAGQALRGVLLRIGFTADLCYHRNG